jgi:hypothetical protein
MQTTKVVGCVFHPSATSWKRKCHHGITYKKGWFISAAESCCDAPVSAALTADATKIVFQFISAGSCCDAPVSAALTADATKIVFQFISAGSCCDAPVSAAYAAGTQSYGLLVYTQQEVAV